MPTMTQELKKFYTLDEAAEVLGIKRSTIYPYLTRLGIKGERYGRSRKHFITAAQLEQVRDLKECPWKYPLTGDDIPG